MFKLPLVNLVFLALTGITLAHPTAQQNTSTFVPASTRSTLRRDPSSTTSGLATVYTSCINKGQVAVTFDDGPYIYMKEISDQLTQHGAKGTFFVNGNNYGCIYSDDNVARIRYALSQGHEIASHTWSHPHLTELTSNQVKSELTRINDALRKTLGIIPRFMRPPYGEYNDEVRKVANSLGQSVVIWDQDSGDSDGYDMKYQKSIYKDFVSRNPKASGTAIFLNHETHDTTAHELLPYAIQQLQSAGYQLVALSVCLGIDPYLSQGAPSKKDSTWKC
ncbi:carbohydrate esterase family 4 protein [Cantharellus anzutake]|uniref:carbohydrate esterase family 4 protein n=1 Tax=Cantharellus anzutake TaxID=1750568 RepID=UPI001905DF75|nr:carbohydrate esterase family 4 protein [Cantharellus anzutake]KAF8335686.1 carbohydrate esterase family 4 protein [Cantharellus anzutake]